jgi:hypothetical protein
MSAWPLLTASMTAGGPAIGLNSTGMPSRLPSSRARSADAPRMAPVARSCTACAGLLLR